MLRGRQARSVVDSMELADWRDDVGIHVEPSNVSALKRHAFLVVPRARPAPSILVRGEQN